jgi:hypothetical protein
MKIWALTTYQREATKKFGDQKVRDRRTVGLYDTQDRAIEVVEGNYGDIEEHGYYQFAVVEPLPLGLYPINREADRIWFEFQQVSDQPCTEGCRDPQWCDHNHKWVRLPVGTPQVLKDQYSIGKGGPRDFTNWSEVC